MNYVQKYRTGECFAMAEALHQLTGFPVRHIDYGSAVHAFVIADNGDAIDIHGRMPWDSYLSFLVSQNVLPALAVSQGLVEHKEIPTEISILWREAGYKKPSRAKIKEAKCVALGHPNLADTIKEIVGQKNKVKERQRGG